MLTESGAGTGMTREEYRAAAEDVIYLCSCMVNGEKPDAGRAAVMDPEKLYQAADRHMLTCIVGYALESAGVRESAFIQAVGKAVRRAILFDTERRAVLDELEKAGIRHMPLKGCIMKDYYPRAGMREMADNDILYDRSRSADVRRIMESLGFETAIYARNDYSHDCYHKAPVCNFEMHRALFTPFNGRKLFHYYRDYPEEKMIRNEGSDYRYHLSSEDFYIYMIAHEYKHYSRSGTGLRSVLDTYVFLCREQPDMTYVHGEMEKLGITEFEAMNRSLAMSLFGGKPLTEKAEEMLDYILSSGTYGKTENSITNQLKEKGKWGYFITRAFLPYDMMTQIYPVLAKLPVLLPLLWIHRLVHAFFFKHKKLMYQLKAVLKWKG